ncbi:MAG: RsmE family RNA methyltransferase [Phycisphaerales bacterium JB058]
MHRISLANSGEPLQQGECVRITGDEARHAVKVKRLEPGERLELLTGSGLVAEASMVGAEKLGKKDGWAIDVRVEAVRRAPPVYPQIDVRSAVPKGPRLEEMVDQLGQIGATSWGPLRSERSVVNPREGKLGRLERICEESAKQCGRAWLMRIERALQFKELLDAPGPIVVADQSGEPYQPMRVQRLTLAVGPEGGWTSAELELLRRSGARITRFGSHVMRVETAAAAACAIIMDLEQRQGPPPGIPGEEASE